MINTIIFKGGGITHHFYYQYFADLREGGHAGGVTPPALVPP